MQSDLNDLAYFVHIVDHSGIAAAARALGEPKSKLSRRLTALENRLGVTLIHRSSRRFAVTEIGEIYYHHCKAMLVEAEAAQEAIELTRAEPCGIVRVTCPVGLLAATAGDMLARFLCQCPLVQLHLDATDREVDPVGDAVDVALRVRPFPLRDSDLVVRVLGGECRQVLVAGTTLLARHGIPEQPQDLAAMPSLGLGLPQQEFAWELVDENNHTQRIRHHPRLITRNMSTLAVAAIAGVGIVQLPTLVIREALQHKQLVELLPAWVLPSERVHAVFPS